ncbi:MAG: hypothetical protein QHH06_14005 [Clostridiales bacterium]|jgi:hypothetical protein|nr:hypothetical protein [Eubacteriales bacterium]MDH7567557.1 hypothetical protein [Clostridiales bacterium]
MDKRNSIALGVIFVVLGALFLMKSLNIVYFDIFDIGFILSKFWAAIFLILPGIAMHSIYFSGKNNSPGILVPAGILLVTGVTCQISALFHLWGALWPGYILAVAVGLFELYLFGGRKKGLLIPVAILGGMSLIFFNSFTFNWIFGRRFGDFFVPVLLILLGIMVIFKNSRPRDSF